VACFATMDTHDSLVAWLFLEGLLLLPAVAAISVLLLRIWLLRTFRNFPEDTYLGMVAYPFIGAVSGAVVSFGVSDFLRSDAITGTAYVFAGLAITVYAGGSLARDRAREEEKPRDSFSVEEWRRDLDHLRQLRRVSLGVGANPTAAAAALGRGRSIAAPASGPTDLSRPRQWRIMPHQPYGNPCLSLITGSCGPWRGADGRAGGGGADYWDPGSARVRLCGVSGPASVVRGRR
jgi:hypothetical protein